MREYVTVAKWLGLLATLSLAVYLVVAWYYRDAPDETDFPSGPILLAVLAWLGFLFFAGFALLMLIVGWLRTRRS